MLAIIEAYRAGLLKPKNWWVNVVAGLIVGVVALPLAMAFAIASGVKPEQGIYTAIVAGIVVGIFGGSRVQISGPTGAFIVILASITAQYGVAGLQMAAMIAGVFLLIMGFLKLGSVIKFIPEPVIVGFTAGIGVIIFVGEWKDFFGLPIHLPLDMPFYQKLWMLIKALPHFDWATTALAALSVLLVLFSPKLLKRVPSPLIAMVVTTALQAIFHFQNVNTLGKAFGGIPHHLPHFTLPDLTRMHTNLIWPAFTIALLGAIESLLSAAAADSMANTRHDSNQELIGQGLANIIAPLFGGFAATGAIARTATNIRNGGNCPLAAIIHAMVLILVLVLLAPLASDIPLCTLAAILFVVAYNMSDIPHFAHIVRRAPLADVMILLVTFLLTVLTNLVIAVNLGVLLAMIFFIRRMHQFVDVELTTGNAIQLSEDILIYTIQGPVFFGVAEKVEHALAVTHTDPEIVIFRLKNMPFIDMTGLETFDEIVQKYHQRGIKVYLCEANARVSRKLANISLLRWVEEKKIFDSMEEIISQAL
ncbi:MAG TPA: SulP family inorganic anion transporter [Gammaproteobacteria bacterium]|nr:SulP family inorganic anion transporter [Gammaproteobacteria bacterium]